MQEQFSKNISCERCQMSGAEPSPVGQKAVDFEVIHLKAALHSATCSAQYYTMRSKCPVSRNWTIGNATANTRCKLRCKFCSRPSPNYPSVKREATTENK